MQKAHFKTIGVDKRFEQTLHKNKCRNSQQVHETMVNIDTCWGIANENRREMILYIHSRG